jgi:hypothetical protein
MAPRRLRRGEDESVLGSHYLGLDHASPSLISGSSKDGSNVRSGDDGMNGPNVLGIVGCQVLEDEMA